MAIWSVEYKIRSMASNVGSTVGPSYTYGDVKLILTFESDYEGNHKVDYRMYYVKDTYNQMTIGEIRFQFGTKQVFYRAPTAYKMYNDGDLIASGKFEYTGTGNVQVILQAGIYEHAINLRGQEALSLQTATNPELITASIYTNAVVGEKVNIMLKNFTYLDDANTGIGTSHTSATLRYKVGNLEGTIVEKHEKTYFEWNIPTLFYTYYPDVTTTSAILYCDTYDFAGINVIGTTQYNFTLYFVDGPDLDPEVKDINPVTVALTGADYKFVRFFSDAEYNFNAAPGEGTYLRSGSVTCGNKTVSHKSTDASTYKGTIQDVEDATFAFSVTDARNYTKTQEVSYTLIEYIKLTCNIWRIEATGDGTIKVGVGGECWSSNFGKVRNTLRVSYRYKEGDGEFSEWQGIDYLTDDNKYELTVTLNDLDYTKTYTFEAMAEDKLMTVVSKQLPVRAIPVYDWGRDDFNVNVNFNMNHNTILRHNHLANNVVLSSSGGFIYFRPLGTNETSAEVKINPQGNIELAGDIIISGKSLKSLLGI